MRPASLADLLACTGARSAGASAASAPAVLGVSTDTRSIRPGDLYVALRGASFDGHAFLGAAADAGASALCASDPALLAETLARCGDRPIGALLVDDTLAAYQRIAAWHRASLPAKVLAVTGSVGKTSTRDLAAAALAAGLRTHRTAANLNNEIGLPKTLLEADETHEAIVVEMGMRAAGEIATLSRIAAPDGAAVTNVGTAHIEFLGSREAILAAKMEIAEGLRDGGALFLNLDDPRLRGWAAAVPASGRLPATGRRAAIVALRTEEGEGGAPPPSCAASLTARRIRIGADGARFDAERTDGEGTSLLRDVFVPVPGIHAVRNALVALAAAAWAGVAPERAAAGIAAFAPTGARMRVSDLGRIVLVDDSYNASPESMEAAFAAQRALAAGRRTVAALGGMNELGAHAEAAHRATGAAAAKAGVRLLLATGPHADALADGYRASAPPDGAAFVASDVEALSEALLPRLADGDVVLVKGSRGFAMERVARTVAARYDGSREEPA